MKVDYKIVDSRNRKLVVMKGVYYECKVFLADLEKEAKFVGYKWVLNKDTATLMEMRTGKQMQTIKIIKDF